MSPIDFEIWLNHFEYHAQHPRCLPLGLSDRLKPGERRLIASSIATFQLGEQSEGRSLLRAARRFGCARRIPELARIIELFIGEEPLMRVGHRAFFAGTACAVWCTHRRVLRSAGFSPGSFLRASLSQYAFYLEPVGVTLACRGVSV